jgi:lipopolysaccharide export system protein LptA
MISALFCLRWPVRSMLPAALGLSLALAVAPTWAERADRLQPMHIEADALRYDDARQTSVFTGNVVITKGTILIRGQQVEVRQDAQGNQFGTITGTPQRRAFFRQKREGLDEYIEGEALRIDYDGQTETVRFTDQAVLRRYRGTALNDEARGALIVYNGTTETFTVDGGGSAARTPDNPSGRVRAMLTPPPPADAPAPATGAPAPLQPSIQMEPRR